MRRSEVLLRRGPPTFTAATRFPTAYFFSPRTKPLCHHSTPFHRLSASSSSDDCNTKLSFHRQRKFFSTTTTKSAASSSSAPVSTITVEPSCWEAVIGLEVHAQVASNTKLFSVASASFDAAPNTNVSFFDAAYPGTLPSLNQKCVEQAIRAGLAFNGSINPVSTFDRKHYFYCDLPSGYQITQQGAPIVKGGRIVLFPGTSQERIVELDRIQLEQDSGKSFHDQHPDQTFVDLNRAGMALLEIISKPQISSAEEAAEYLQRMQQLLKHVGVIDQKSMDASALRCDVNVSVRRKGSSELGTRCEVKNVNSIKSITRAIGSSIFSLSHRQVLFVLFVYPLVLCVLYSYFYLLKKKKKNKTEFEIQRQTQLLEQGERVHQETRSFDGINGTTSRMRSKEDEVDYRYFPEPDLPPLILSSQVVEDIQQSLPEMPDERLKRFMRDYQLSHYDSSVLVQDEATADFLEAAVRHLLSSSSQKGEEKKKEAAQTVSNWITSDLFGLLKQNSREMSTSPVSPKQLASVIQLLERGSISGKVGKQVLAVMFEEGLDAEEQEEEQTEKQVRREAEEIVKEKGWMLVEDEQLVEKLCAQVIAENPKDVAKYKAGRKGVKQFLLGQVLKLSQGKLTPKSVSETLDKQLS
ncbi:Aspartyl/glutamyl-tRNA(Asn/Gln) amidotransferase subunit B [Balamuthia mandrillaris]